MSFSFSTFLVSEVPRLEQVGGVVSLSFPFFCFAEGVCWEADAPQNEGVRPVVGWGWGGGGVGAGLGGGGVESVHVEQAGVPGHRAGRVFFFLFSSLVVVSCSLPEAPGCVCVVCVCAFFLQRANCWTTMTM